MASSQQQIVYAGDDDAAALFHSYPCAAYFVQSPSSASHSGNNTSEHVLCTGRQPSSSIDSGSPFGPTRSQASVGGGVEHELESAHRQALSHYSSSRGSNNSFLTDKKLQANAYELDDQQEKKIVALMRDGEEMDGGHAWRRKRGLMRRLVVLDSGRDAHHFYRLVFQLAWRLLGSLGLALLVFFFATKPPTPQVSFNIVGVEHFSLGEGLDVTGVATKVLTCNCSVKMEVDNKSKVFGLHILPPFIELAFGRLKFASAQVQSQSSYVQSASSSVQRLFVGVRNKPMYGAGRSMQDLLESGRGLPLIVRVRSLSTYRVVWDLIKIKNHHHEDCIIILQGMHDHKLYAKMHNSTCFQA